MYIKYVYKNIIRLRSVATVYKIFYLYYLIYSYNGLNELIKYV